MANWTRLTSGDIRYEKTRPIANGNSAPRDDQTSQAMTRTAAMTSSVRYCCIRSARLFVSTGTWHPPLVARWPQDDTRSRQARQQPRDGFHGAVVCDVDRRLRLQ